MTMTPSEKQKQLEAALAAYHERADGETRSVAAAAGKDFATDVERILRESSSKRATKT